MPFSQKRTPPFLEMRDSLKNAPELPAEISKQISDLDERYSVILKEHAADKLFVPESNESAAIELLYSWSEFTQRLKAGNVVDAELAIQRAVSQRPTDIAAVYLPLWQTVGSWHDLFVREEAKYYDHIDKGDALAGHGKDSAAIVEYQARIRTSSQTRPSRRKSKSSANNRSAYEPDIRLFLACADSVRQTFGCVFLIAGFAVAAWLYAQKAPIIDSVRYQPSSLLAERLSGLQFMYEDSQRLVMKFKGASDFPAPYAAASFKPQFSPQYSNLKEFQDLHDELAHISSGKDVMKRFVTDHVDSLLSNIQQKLLAHAASLAPPAVPVPQGPAPQATVRTR